MTGSIFFYSALTPASPLVIPNLVAHWPMNDASGTSVADASGNGRTGTATGTPTWGTGRFGGCLNFDGVDDYVSVADHASLNFGASQDFTVSLWLNTTTTASAGLWPLAIGKIDVTSHFALILDESVDVPGEWYWQLKSASVKYSCTSTTTLRDGSWHHIVGQREGTTSRVFRDNVQVGTITNAGVSGSLSNTTALEMGRYSAADPQRYTGALDDIRIYSRALTTTEIDALYNGTQA